MAPDALHELAEVVSRRAAIAAATEDLDEGTHLASTLLREHTLKLADSHAEYSVLENAVFGSSTVNRVRFGTAVEIRTEPLDTDFLVGIPLAGQVDVQYGDRTHVGSRGDAYVVGPDFRMDAAIREDHDQLILRLAAHQVQDVAAQIGNVSPEALRRFPLLAGPLQPGLTRFLAGALELQSTTEGKARRSATIEAIIIESLLLPHAEQLGLGQARALVGRAALVRRVKDELLADESSPPALSQVAKRLGVSVRTIQIAFRSETGQTPTGWLREERLLRAHRQLLSNDPRSTTVTKVASDLGFFHMGDFGQQFKSRFGVSPSAVLRTES